MNPIKRILWQGDTIEIVRAFSSAQYRLSDLSVCSRKRFVNALSGMHYAGFRTDDRGSIITFFDR